MLTSSVGPRDKLLIAANGAYGLRMADISQKAGLPYMLYEEKYDRIPNVDEIEKRLKEAPDITHAAVVHCEQPLAF